MAPIPLTDMSVLVLGGSGVLGSEVARRLAGRGARITLAGRSEDRLARTAASIDGAVSCRFDLREASLAEVPVNAAIDAFGRLDGIVNAAGVVAFGPLAETDPAVIEEVVATDLTGPLIVYRRAIPRMDGGFIANITGVVASMPTAGMATYSAAKAGLSAATVAMTRELRRSGIQVIDVRPPHTETGLVGRAISGTAPTLPDGLAPGVVADRIVAGIEAGERVVDADSFT